MFKVAVQLILVLSMLSSFFELAATHPERSSHSHSQDLNLSEHSHGESPLQGHEDHCSPDSIRCCHLSFVLRPTDFLWVEKQTKNTYAEVQQDIKPFPILEGPFQPPRA